LDTKEELESLLRHGVVVKHIGHKSKMTLLRSLTLLFKRLQQQSFVRLLGIRIAVLDGLLYLLFEACLMRLGYRYSLFEFEGKFKVFFHSCLFLLAFHILDLGFAILKRIEI